MPDIKHNFTGGKMNKDLDERLVPNGEYRDAMNIQVQTSEGSHVGTIQNILGNNLGCDYSGFNVDNPIPVGSKTIGSVSDEKNDTLYWLVAGADYTLSYPPLNPVSFKDVIMRTNKSNPTGCEPVFVDLWKYCAEVSPFPGLTDNSLTLGDDGSYDFVTPGMYATGYGPTGNVEFGPTLVTDSGNYSWAFLNYDVGADITSTSFTPPTIEIGDVTNTQMFIRGFWNDNGGAAGTGGYTDIHYDIMAPVVNKPMVQLNLPPHGAAQFWIPATDLTAIQAGQLQPLVSMSSIFPQAYHANNGGSSVLNGVASITIDNVAQGQVFDHLGNSINAYIITVGTTPPPHLHNCWSEVNVNHGCAWPVGIWQKNASISAGFQNGEAYPFYELKAGIQPLSITSGIPTPTNTIEINDPQSQDSLDEIFQILFDYDGALSYPPAIDPATGQQVQLQVNSSFFPPNSCIDPDSVIDPLNGFNTTPPMTFSNVFEIVDCDDYSIPHVATGFNTTNEYVILSTAVANGVMKVWLQDKVDLSTANTVCFEADKTLNFEPNKLITGINVVDDMLFWTDGYHDADNNMQGTEPKKINIKRSIQGTDTSGMTHTNLYVDGVNEGPAREEHVTVIRKAPLAPPALEMTDQIREGILGGQSVLLSNPNATFGTPFYEQVEGDNVWVVVDSINGEHPNFEIGDILRIQAVESGVDFELPKDYHLRLEILNKIPGPFLGYNNVVNATDDQTAYLVRVLTVSNESKQNETSYYTVLEESDSLFERKFPRFAYRYKYVDNEYSSFGPFSEVAFIPGSFNYAPIEAYNIGMTNKVKSLIIKGFVSSDTPKDVVQIDILYKNETSPTVYLLDSVSRNDSTNNWNTSSYKVSTESVFGALPTSQTLRSWDNVPRTATSQEITGNRLVYGNYLQGYDIQQYQNIPTLLQPSITTSLENRIVDSVDYTGKKSIKSLRTYDVGVVWGDKYGRETPVITSTNSSLTVPKSKSLDSSYLVADIGESPHWADYYRFYVKETSNEYYNMPVDRVYDAEDGNIWVSFPSVDRNKVDEDTYITLKKGVDSNELILEDARYKIVAIENEAPEYIKTTFERLVRSNTDSSRQPDSCNMYGGSTSFPCDFASGRNAPDVGRKGFSLKASHWSADYNTDTSTGPRSMGLTSPFVLWNEVKDNSGSSTTDELYVSFTQEITSSTTGETTGPESSKYQVVSVEEVFDADGEIIHYYVNLKTPILSEDDFIVGNGDMAADNIHQLFWKKTIRNKPEFDGRFFVKILNDIAAINNLQIEVGAVNNWKTNASLGLYKIDDSKIISSPGEGYNYAASGNPSTSTRTSARWTSILKFGGSSTKSEWFIDGASFAGRQGGDPYAANGNYGSSNVQTSFIDSSGTTFDSCDVTSSYAQSLSGFCTVYPPPFFVGIDIPFSINLGDAASIAGSAAQLLGLSLPSGFGIDVGNGASNGLIGMKGVHENGGQKYFDLAHSKIGPTGATGFTTNYDLNWEEANNEAEIVSNLDIGKRFRLQNDSNSVIYKIVGVQKFRLFNYHGKKTASPSHFGNPGGVCSRFWNTKQDNQVNAMGNTINRRVTYRINYEVDIPASPDGTCADPLDQSTCPKLSDNSVYGNIDDTNSVNLHFIEEFRVDGENPISKNPAIFETEPKEDVDLDLYYEASSSLPTFPITETNKFSYIPVGATIVPPPIGGSSVIFPEGVFITGWEYIDPISPQYIIKFSTALTIDEINFLQNQTILTLLKDNGELVQADIGGAANFLGPNLDGINIYGGMAITPISKIGLNWFNCWSFNNGVESNRVGDTFNKPFLTNGATVSTTTEERFKEEHRKYGLIYSGLYNSNSGINSLNEFIQAEKITKDINPTYGSIQKLHSGWGQGGDLVALCEDRILKILANKDALYNADGNSNVTSTNNVLGQTIPYSGEFGISKNPESFASDAYRAYFTDKVRGAVMRLSMDGLTPISEHGMKDWFRDNLKLGGKIIGSYDDRQDEYNITLPITTDSSLPSILTARTVSFSERAKGWISFKSFVPENGISCANDYYTFKDGNLYKHHDETVDRNTFYPTVGIPGNYTDSSFTVLINESPGSVKTFHTLNYEGSQSKIDQLVSQSTGTIGAYDTFLPTNPSVVDTTHNSSEYYNLNGEDGWYVQSIKTDLEEGSLNEFIEKEGKWFNYIKGIPGSITDGANIDGFRNYNVSFQGLGRLAGSASVSSVYGCTDCGTTDSSTIPVYTYPDSTNCDPAATVDNGSCIPTSVGCTDLMATVNYDPTANWDIWTNTGIPHTGACQYHGCTDPLANNYDANANYNDGTCNYPVIGCMDLTAANYDVANDTPCDGTNDPLQPCVADASGTMQSGPDCCCGPIILGCTDPLADNHDPVANTDDGSCLYTALGCTTPSACEYDALANTDDGSCTWCDDPLGNNYDGSGVAMCNTGCTFCKDPINFQLTGSTSPSEIEVSWQEVIVDAPVNIYKIRYRIAGSSDPWTVSAAGGGGTNGSTMTYTITNLTANTSYDVQLKAVCVAGQSPHNPTHYTATAWSSALTETTTLIPVPGCMDGTGVVPPGNPIGSWPACNYNPFATVDDGSCEYDSCHGCEQSSFVEFCDTCWDSVNQAAVADGSGGPWLGEMAGDCITLATTGCTDITAVNWNSTAIIDDGSCIAAVPGCTDNTTLDYSDNVSATNYDSTANVDNSSCTYLFNLSGSWLPYNDPAVNGSYADGWVFVLEAPDIPTGASPSTLQMSLNGDPFAANNYGYNVNSATTIESQLQNNLTADLMHVSNSSLENSDTNQFSSWDSLATLSWVLPNIGLIEQDLVDAITLIPGCMDSTSCNYDSSATYEYPTACAQPGGCMDPSFDSYDSITACSDPDLCWNCATDPNVASAYATTTANPNVYKIKWSGQGGVTTNHHNGENYSGSLDISTKRAYTIRFRYKIGSSAWTAYAAYEPPTTDFFDALSDCTKQSAGSNSTGFPIGQTYIPWVTNGSGAYASGVKWQFEVQNECNSLANCATGPVVTTPEITLS